MPALKVRGLHTADTASIYSTDEVGTIDDTFLFPKWWDKKANNVEYIRCFKLHMSRVCDDIDLIIPASHDVEIRGEYDGNVGFRIDYHRGVKRMALTAHNSTTVVAEYVFPTRPSQQPSYKEFGAGPIVCFSSSVLGDWETFYFEHKPTLDLGTLTAADGFYDLNQEEFHGFDMGDLPEPPDVIADLGTVTFIMSAPPDNAANGLTVNAVRTANVESYKGSELLDYGLFNYEWTLPPFLEFTSDSLHESDGYIAEFKVKSSGAGLIRCNVTIKNPDEFSMDNWEPHTVSLQVYSS